MPRLTAPIYGLECHDWYFLNVAGTLSAPSFVNLYAAVRNGLEHFTDQTGRIHLVRNYLYVSGANPPQPAPPARPRAGQQIEIDVPYRNVGIWS